MPIIVLRKEIDAALSGSPSFVQIDSSQPTIVTEIYQPKGVLLKCSVPNSDVWLFNMSVPRQFKNWYLTDCPRFTFDLAVSYTQNKLMAKWLNCSRERIVALLYKPIRKDVWFAAESNNGFSTPIMETLTVSWSGLPSNVYIGHCYPNLQTLKYQVLCDQRLSISWTEEYVLADLLLVEVVPDFCLQELEFDLYCYAMPMTPKCQAVKHEWQWTTRMFGSDAIELISTSQSRIYALPLGNNDDSVFNNAEDISRYVKNIYQWSEDFSNNQTTLEEHPATLFYRSRFCISDEFSSLINFNLIKFSMWSLEF